MKYEIVKELRLLNNSIRKHLASLASKNDTDKVTFFYGWLIGYLYDHKNEEIFQKDIEREFCICRSTTSKMIDSMENSGLVNRVKVDYDDRLKKIVLTDKSKELAKRINIDNLKTEEKLTAGFSDDELKTLGGFLDRMKENISK